MNQQNISSVLVTKELLHIFDLVITTDEAEFLLSLGTKKYTQNEILTKSGMSEDIFSEYLKKLMRKGLVLQRTTDNKSEYYELAPILVGWFEIFLFSGERTEDQQEFSRRLDDLFTCWKKYNFTPLRQIRNVMNRFDKPDHRILPTPSLKKSKSKKIQVNKLVTDSTSQVLLTQEVAEIVEKYGDKQEISLVHCFCREWHDMVNNPCSFDLPREACIVLGDFAEHVAKNGIGRKITKEEAIDVIIKSGKKGAIHMVFYEREDTALPEIGICNCCWDCCGVLSTYNRGISGLHFHSSVKAVVTDPDECSGCSKCIRYCPVNALSLKNKKIIMDTSLCIGCGQCQLQCPKSVFKMQNHEREVFLPLLAQKNVRLKK